MADFDVNSLLQNPMLLAGLGLLGSKGNNVAGNIAQGIQSAQQQQLGPVTLALKKLELQRAQNAMNFNPADYLQTDQSGPNGLLSGSSASLQSQATQPNAMPSALAGPIGGGVGMPVAQTPSQGQVNFAPGAPIAGPNSSIDLPGMVAAGLKAGFNPQDMGMIAQSMNPMYYAKLQAMTKMYQPVKLGPAENLVIPAMAGGGDNGQVGGAGGAGNGVIATNNNPPPSSELGQLNALTAARDKYPVGSPQYKILDAAINQKSGAASQDFREQSLNMMKYRTFGDPEGNAEIAKSIANYRVAPLSGYALRTPQGQAVMAEVMRQNPDYNAQNYQSSQKAYSAFTSGTQGNVVRSMNVGIDHLATLNQLVSDLNNGDLQAVNRLANVYKAQTGQTGPTNFEAAKKIVGDEIAKAIVGSTNAAQDRQAMQEALAATNSPQQLQGVIQTFTKLMAGQLGGLKRQYSTSTMRDDFEKFLSPNAKSALEGGAFRVPIRTGLVNGKRVAQYQDGSIEFMDK